jgi:hypothetical protein
MISEKGRLTVIFQDRTCHQRTIVKTVEFFGDQIITCLTPQFNGGPQNYENTIQRALNFLKKVPPPCGAEFITVEECEFDRLRDWEWEGKIWECVKRLKTDYMCPVLWKSVKHITDMIVIE